MKTAESVGNLVELGLTSTSVSEFLSPSASEPHERHEVSRSSSVASATGVLEEKADAFTRSPSQVGMKRKIMTLPITSPGRSPEGLAMATTKTFVDEKVLSLSIKEVQIDMPITKKRSPSLDAVSPSVLTRSRSNTPRAQPLKANVDGVLYPSGALSEKLTKSVSKPKMVVTFSPPLERNSLSSNSLQDFSVQSYEQRIDNNSSSVDEVDTAMSVPSVSYITVDEK